MEITERSVTTEVHAFIHKEGETFTMFTHIDTHTLHNMLDKEREKEGYRVQGTLMEKYEVHKKTREPR